MLLARVADAVRLVVLPLLPDDLHPGAGVQLVVRSLLGAAGTEADGYVTAVVAVGVPVAHFAGGAIGVLSKW